MSPRDQETMRLALAYAVAHVAFMNDEGDPRAPDKAKSALEAHLATPPAPSQEPANLSAAWNAVRVEALKLSNGRPIPGLLQAASALCDAVQDHERAFMLALAPQDGSKAPAADSQDAARYRWLRQQDWFSSDLCVLREPKRVLTRGIGLGADCPSLHRLDAAIDAAMAAAPLQQAGESKA